MGLAGRTQALIRRLRRAWQLRRRPAVEMPSRILPGDAPSIHDGVTYALPVLLPGALRRRLVEQGRLRDYLLENSRDSYRFQFDTPGRSASDNLILPVTEDPLREWHWATRISVLSNCHAAYSRNPIARRAVHYVSAFVVGDGFNLSCMNKDVEKCLQEFIDSTDNAIREYERQAVRDLLVDGELFLRYFAGDGAAAGQVVVVPLRPWEIQYIQTEPNFFRRPLVYRLQPYSQYNTDAPMQNDNITAYDIDAQHVQHVAINRHSYELRGRPELYSALPWLRAHKEWLENRARQNHWRGALLWWVKIAAAAPGIIAAKVAQYQRPPTPGSIAVTSDKEEWQALHNPVGASDAGEDGRQLKINALNGIAGIPEYMTGDGENANLATSKSQQLPVLKTFSEFQTIMREQVWLPMFRRVLQAAIDAGTLPEMVEEQDADGDPVYDEAPIGKPAPVVPYLPPNPVGSGSTPTPAQAAGPSITQDAAPLRKAKQIAALDAFEVEYEPVGDADMHTLAQALDIASGNGWVSDQTATTELGFDHAIEQKRIARERKGKLDAMARGEIPTPPGTTPDGMADDGEDDPDGNEQAGQGEPEKQGAVA